MMTIIVDTDGDGEPDAVFPVRWVALLLGLGASICGVTGYIPW